MARQDSFDDTPFIVGKEAPTIYQSYGYNYQPIPNNRRQVSRKSDMRLPDIHDR